MKRFLCLMTSGIPFPDDISDFLVNLAVKMKREKLEKQSFKSTTYEGEMRTKFTPYFIASAMSGILFTATLECEEGKTEVRFLVDTKNLRYRENYEWGDWQRVDNDHPANKASYN
jgi:hypothetical protein